MATLLRGITGKIKEDTTHLDRNIRGRGDMDRKGDTTIKADHNTLNKEATDQEDLMARLKGDIIKITEAWVLRLDAWLRCWAFSPRVVVWMLVCFSSWIRGTEGIAGGEPEIGYTARYHRQGVERKGWRGGRRRIVSYKDSNGRRTVGWLDLSLIFRIGTKAHLHLWKDRRG